MLSHEQIEIITKQLCIVFGADNSTDHLSLRKRFLQHYRISEPLNITKKIAIDAQKNIASIEEIIRESGSVPYLPPNEPINNETSIKTGCFCAGASIGPKVSSYRDRDAKIHFNENILKEVCAYRASKSNNPLNGVLVVCAKCYFERGIGKGLQLFETPCTCVLRSNILIPPVTAVPTFLKNVPVQDILQLCTTSSMGSCRDEVEAARDFMNFQIARSTLSNPREPNTISSECKPSKEDFSLFRDKIEANSIATKAGHRFEVPTSPNRIQRTNLKDFTTPKSPLRILAAKSTDSTTSQNDRSSARNQMSLFLSPSRGSRLIIDGESSNWKSTIQTIDELKLIPRQASPLRAKLLDEVLQKLVCDRERIDQENNSEADISVVNEEFGIMDCDLASEDGIVKQQNHDDTIGKKNTNVSDKKSNERKTNKNDKEQMDNLKRFEADAFDKFLFSNVSFKQPKPRKAKFIFVEDGAERQKLRMQKNFATLFPHLVFIDMIPLKAKDENPETISQIASKISKKTKEKVGTVLRKQPSGGILSAPSQDLLFEDNKNDIKQNQRVIKNEVPLNIPKKEISTTNIMISSQNEKEKHNEFPHIDATSSFDNSKQPHKLTSILKKEAFISDEF